MRLKATVAPMVEMVVIYSCDRADSEQGRRRRGKWKREGGRFCRVVNGENYEVFGGQGPVAASRSNECERGGGACGGRIGGFGNGKGARGQSNNMHSLERGQISTIEE